MFSFCTVYIGQHLRIFYPGIFIFGAIHKNLVQRKFPAIQYIFPVYPMLVVCFVKNLHQLTVCIVCCLWFLFEDLDDCEVITGCHQNRISIPPASRETSASLAGWHKSSDIFCLCIYSLYMINNMSSVMNYLDFVMKHQCMRELSVAIC